MERMRGIGERDRIGWDKEGEGEGDVERGMVEGRFN